MNDQTFLKELLKTQAAQARALNVIAAVLEKLVQHQTTETALDEALRDHINTLDAKVQFAVDHMNEKGVLDEACFTFPDGETVWATHVAGEENE